jgi:hypothetical protein
MPHTAVDFKTKSEFNLPCLASSRGRQNGGLGHTGIGDLAVCHKFINLLPWYELYRRHLKIFILSMIYLGHTAIGFVAVEYSINLPRALCTLLVFSRIFDSIVLEDFQSIIRIYFCCALLLLVLNNQNNYNMEMGLSKCL